jgi:pyruvate formate lyase activating enzyme
MSAVKGIVFDLKKFAIHDGPGIRTTVFLKGCPLACWWCHNPEGQAPRPEAMCGPRAAAGPMATGETVGRTLSVAGLLAEIEKDTIFYDTSGGGVTFSGGEPLAQPEFLGAALSACRQAGLHTALDTSGYAPRDVLARVAPAVDLFLYDLKLMDDQRHRRCTGVSNHPILENLAWLAATGRTLAVRLPLVPGITDDAENLGAAADFLAGLQRAPRVDLLAYHRIHNDKYRRLGRANPMGDTAPPGAAALEAARAIFAARGLPVSIGG